MWQCVLGLAALVTCAGCADTLSGDPSIHYEGNGYVFVDIEGQTLRQTELIGVQPGMRGMTGNRGDCSPFTKTVKLTARQVAAIHDLLTKHNVFKYLRVYPTASGKEGTRHAAMRYRLRIIREGEFVSTEWDATSRCPAPEFVWALRGLCNADW